MPQHPSCAHTSHGIVIAWLGVGRRLLPSHLGELCSFLTPRTHRLGFATHIVSSLLADLNTRSTGRLEAPREAEVGGDIDNGFEG